MHPNLSRYSCQVALPGFGEHAQYLLQQAKVLIVGAGGLGCPAAQYLTSSGVGTIGIADFDTVSVSNLHRQILYGPDDVGKLKAEVACEQLQKQNPDVNLLSFTDKITPANILQIIDGYDIIVDCSDNFETRYLLNDAAVILGKPLVYGAIYQYEGQVAVWNVKDQDGKSSPNYRDVYPQVDASQIPNCAVGGVIPTLCGIIGCMQANEVIKLITKTGEQLVGKVLIFDAQTMQSRIIKIGTSTKTNITPLQQSADIPIISAAETKHGLANHTIELVDIRTDQERDEYNIGGIHFELDELEDNIDEFNAGKTYVFYCSSGKRSAEAIRVLQQKLPGVKAYSLDGGLGEWNRD
ncbi:MULTISPECIES: HesA/MoeB/ThiF family protein [unclassified Mucilaginibacter]|uniref:HesA/MoeB/ThiF family protein n=1 Tax=unclassified Mucilaginibacter TaxID=2617802 RepID=UPI002AC90361|nr:MULTISPECIES: HesA/MoeB/ThiF family protein [unclassified Mucilaginibacter]MEB0262699.1 HesA/MoeB/ThiF family protein [Mucilaginibacter sp. 10I4]MEB0279463.1 HesA/MoeB/ThiF family protein [Mucilaginibacter sp. 10B2]MEB0300024.1 HesA/MoeB/ThiF family protein [Mucilaginibacter sp. 5C4]WPX21837.1 HesA/MoeB/ThiF family protein [Mucilaginibacter sp. 5C4]